MSLITEKPVLVTGANGFLATHIIEQLLEKGYKVRGTVRKLGADKNEHLLKLKGASDRLELVELNLLGEQSQFNKVAEGCDYIIHTASPFSMDVRDPQKDLVEPALKGTEGVLKASTSSRAKKVVLTSSMASVTDEPISGHVYTENDWNTLSSLSRNPYYYSKTVAERYAWKYVEDLPKDQKLDLVVMNPYFIIGPSHSKTQGINDSVKSIYQSMNGELPGIMDLCWGFVDVRDVAKAHILGMERQNASGRYLLVNPNGILKMRDTIEILKKNYPNFRYPAASLDGCVGTSVVKAASYFQPGQVGQYLRLSLGHSFTYDPSKGKKELDMNYISIEKTLCDTAASLIEQGFLHEKSKKK